MIQLASYVASYAVTFERNNCHEFCDDFTTCKLIILKYQLNLEIKIAQTLPELPTVIYKLPQIIMCMLAIVHVCQPYA